MKREHSAQNDSPVLSAPENYNMVNPFIHKYYVGIDIGYKFHVAACIPTSYFLDRNEPWKKTKTVKFLSNSEGFSELLSALEKVSNVPQEFFILMEPTGGHYGYAIMRMLMDRGYTLYYVDNKAVKDFRERFLSIKEKSDQVDARVMAYMGFHKALNPSLGGVRIVTPSSPVQTILRSISRDRWLLNKQLTRVRNQVLQLFSVTNPELKSIFTQPSRPAILKLARMYPTLKDIDMESEENLRKHLVAFGANRIAKTAASKLKMASSLRSIIIDSPHIIARQNWLIDEALRMQESINALDNHLHDLLHGNIEKRIEPHPYVRVLFSLPTMSDNWAATLIGVIGDVERFPSYREFKCYLGFTPTGKSSGTSVDKKSLSYDGVRDTRRVLFQMTLVLLSPNVKPNPFREVFVRLTQRAAPMPKMKAIGHICGRISQILYSCLKNDRLYDPSIHARRSNLPMNEAYLNKIEILEDIGQLEAEAENLALVSTLERK